MKHDYEMEELVPIVAELAGKYTANESTSISYERAEQLMGAVLYCIAEYEQADNDGISEGMMPADVQASVSAREAYERGFLLVKEKVQKLRELYNAMIPDFDSYGNKCLADTVQKGIPQFFLRYDILFAPQETLLTLDYPVPVRLTALSGVDSVYEYVKYIAKEQEYLRNFAREDIIRELFAYSGRYEDLIENLIEMLTWKKDKDVS